jgi:hypothetical protein
MAQYLKFIETFQHFRGTGICRWLSPWEGVSFHERLKEKEIELLK